METGLVTSDQRPLVPQHAVDVQDYLEASTSLNTRRAYRAAWRRFAAWCQAHGYEPLPAAPATLAAYLSARATAGAARSTVTVAVAAVRKAHAAANLPSPVTDAVRQVLKGITRQAPAPNQVAGIRWDVADVIATIAAGQGLAGLRDAAIFATMSDAMLRVSECRALDVVDLEAEAPGTLLIRRSKTDQEGRGAVLTLRSSTVRRVRRWLEAAGIEGGALFRRIRYGDHAQPGRLSVESLRDLIRTRVQEAVAAGEIEPLGRVSGHSFRVGSSQSLAIAGASLVEMQLAGRWTSPAQPGRYARGAIAGRDSPLTRYRGE